MTTISTPAKNMHARSTVAILATVRMIGMIVFGALIVVTLLSTLIGSAAADDNKVLLFIGGLLITGVQVVFAALWYAGISWLTETLNMLTQIAKNTAA